MGNPGQGAEGMITGIKLAKDFGITFPGFVRGKKMTAYVNDWRIEN